MTKREKFERVINFVNGENVAFTEDERVEFVEWCTKEIASIDHRNETAKKRNAEKRAVGDEITARIEDLLNDEPISVYGLVDALPEFNLTPAKVVARVSKLVREGIANKGEFKAEDGRKIMGYTRA